MSPSAGAVRQSRRLQRLNARGIVRTSVLVHDNARGSLDAIRPALMVPSLAEALAHAWRAFRDAAEPVNVSQVQHRSPFRYPGGKTWLVPEVRSWLSTHTVDRFVEPFAGGASCGLMVAAEGSARVVLGELDPYVSAVWNVIFVAPKKDARWLCEQISGFRCTVKNVRDTLAVEPRTTRDLAWQTIVRNRCARGGILAPGAGLNKSGEAGKGIASRWYPETLVQRITDLVEMRSNVDFVECDAFDLLKKWARRRRTAWFLDPPYTASAKSAGNRLYTAHTIDHVALFAAAAKCAGPVMMTYDDSPEVRKLAAKHRFAISTVPMKSTHHEVHRELILTKD
ncbi:MAG: DNA adenine methylase [Actinomycetia bacterium]|nr:DNA adenine methylase [Actinomycetes bacterium]